MLRTFLTIQQNPATEKAPDDLESALKQTGEEIFSIPTFFFEKVSEIGWSLVTAILVLVIGFWVTKQIKKIIEKRMIARNVDLSIRSFLLPIINIVLKILVIIPVIGRLGLDVSGFFAAITGIGVAIGLALQGSLSNFAAGLLIILFKPFKVGDYIVSQGNEGTVESISMLNTVLATVKGQVVILPNATLFNNPIINYSIKDWRRLDINIGVSYDDDFDKTKEVLINTIKKNELVDQSKDITVEILEFADSSVNLAVRCFVKSSDYWTAYWQLYRSVKYALDQNNISIPYPHTEMILRNNNDDLKV